jgi:aminopeptidase N
MRDAQPRITRLGDYRPPEYLVESTELHFALAEQETRVRARLALHRNPAAVGAGAPLVLHAEELSLRALAIDGRALDPSAYTLDGAELRVPEAPERFVLESEVVIEPQKNTALSGLYRSRGMFCTQCEAEGFRRITPYPDRPDVLAPFTTTIVAERARYPVLLSNGNRVDAGEDGAGRHWVRWHDPFPKPSYLFALVAGDLASLDDRFVTCSGREVLLRIFVEPKDLDKCEFAMAALKQAMRWDEEVYGREYDLDTFMIVAVDDFNMGAMENKGLNIFNTSCVLANAAITTDAGFQRIAGIVAHEYFHNWSGNRVTCRDWFQLSLKEGFTVFRDAEFSADTGSRAVKRIEDVGVLRTQQFAEDAGPLAHPVRPESYIEINNFYTLTVYEKGAEVVRMMRELVGPEAFRRGTDLYFARHDGQAVTVEDFVRAIEEASGRDLGQFRLWYSQAGTPRLAVRGEYDAARRRYRLEVRQSCPPTPGQPHKAPMHVPLRVGLVGTGGELALGPDGERERVLELRAPLEVFEFEGVPEAPVPSLLRGFSAPVRLEYPWTREELGRLMRLDGDGFARWDAGQTLATQVLQARVAGSAQASAGADPLLVEAFRALLLDTRSDPAMLAQMLALPAESYLAELAGVIDPLAIHAARRAERTALARALREEFLACHARNAQQGDYSLDAAQLARRSLRNACLGYLLLLDDPACTALAERQYRAQHNMTDVLAALAGVVHNDRSADRALAAALLEDFRARWSHEPLAMNLWFQVQAQRPSPEALGDIERLYAHPSFDAGNPNKVRALLGAFCAGNSPGFHRTDHAAYRFLGARVAGLDARNPQLAARMLAPLTRWRRFAEPWSGGMRAALEALRAQPSLSPDCFEVVDKSLAVERE